MNKFAYFSSPIYREERPQWVIETLQNTEKYYSETQNWLPENAVVRQTVQMANDPDLGYLSSYFRDAGIGILRDQGYLTEEYEFFVSDMWGQELACSGSHMTHTHGDSQISGFYFLETPKGGSYPVFDDPRPGKRMSDLHYPQGEQVTMATPQIHFNNVLAGTIIMFNSWLPHALTINRSEKPTKFIHFVLSQRKRFL